ncbi:MAG: UDP-N-acetylmuramate--L-alanine ligase [Patescibacteria group bacterium]|jgi:UDP-N-acetylmuramate--alanine ligase|nr:UDP-N-acetylmuramate--L-alanine ligase [Patescibacteria group bacterium]
MDIKTPKKVYFLGIGGIGMSALAKLFAHEGNMVVGADTGFADLEGLKRAKIEVFEGYDESRVDTSIGALVYTLATTDDNVELLKARELNIPIFTYGEMLGIVSKEKNTIAVCGTHGKTTTTAMLAKMLIDANQMPSVIVGSLMTDPKNPQNKTNYIAGVSDLFVVEACEYKKSFLNLWPKIICITNIDADHLDFYGTLPNVILAFKEFIGKLPEDGVVIADLTDPNSKKAVEGAKVKIINSNDFYDPQMKLNVFGDHNRKNASIGLALANHFGISADIASSALESFSGTWRRFEYKGKTENGAIVYDDYGHHPHEILATLKGAREGFADKKLTIVFEPHLYSRTKEHFNDFVDVLSKFDFIYLTEIYGARETFDPTITSSMLALKIKEKNPNVVVEASYEKIAEALKKDAGEKDVIVTMGAGNITKLSDMLIL